MIFIYSLGSVSSLVSEKKIFEISGNQSILLALAAMLNIRLERKTVTLYFFFLNVELQGHTFVSS